jgi:hypothetical protein
MKVLTASYQQLLFYAQLGQATMDLSLKAVHRERDLMVSRERGSESSDRQGGWRWAPQTRAG